MTELSAAQRDAFNRDYANKLREVRRATGKPPSPSTSNAKPGRPPRIFSDVSYRRHGRLLYAAH